MKSKNKKPTEIYCVEDLFKYYLFGQGNLLYICNTISPKIVDLFSKIMDTELFKTLEDLIFAYEQGIISYELYLNEKKKFKDDEKDERKDEWEL